MKASKFVKVLQTLSKKELKGFDLFLHGLYPNQKEALKVFNYIFNIYPDWASEDLGKIVIIEKLELFSYNTTNKEQPKSIADEKAEKKNLSRQKKNLSNILSELYCFLKEYLILEKIKRDTLLKDKQMLEILKVRKLDDIYIAESNKMIEKLESKPTKNIWDYYDLMKLNHDCFYHPDTRKINVKIDSLDLAMQNLNTFAISAKLKMACEMQNRRNILNGRYDKHISQDIIEDCQTKLDDISDTGILYLLLLMMIKGQDDNTIFELLKNILLEEKVELNFDDKLIALSYLINYASAKIKKGNSSYYGQAFQLYKFGLSHKILANENQISSTMFNNVVRIACKLKQFEWKDKFITYWKSALPPGVRDSTVGLASADCLFEQKKFEDVIGALISVQFHDVFFALRAKSLILKSHYELFQDKKNKVYDNENFVLDFTNAFSKYLTRNKKIGSTTQKSYLNFIKFVQKIVKNKTDQEELITNIEAVEHIVFKEWLLTKIRG